MKTSLNQKSKLKILIIEDQLSIIAVWKHFLEPLGCEIYTAISFAKGKELLQELHPELVLLDLRLQDSDAEDTLHRISTLKNVSPETTVVVISGYITPTMAEIAFQHGAQQVVDKAQIDCQTKMWCIIADALKSKKDAPYTYTIDLLEQLTCQYISKQSPSSPYAA